MCIMPIEHFHTVDIMLDHLHIINCMHACMAIVHGFTTEYCVSATAQSSPASESISLFSISVSDNIRDSFVHIMITCYFLEIIFGLGEVTNHATLYFTCTINTFCTNTHVPCGEVWRIHCLSLSGGAQPLSSQQYC